ncbi:MAG: hypothetical protein II945_01690 [Bacteroidales bacterium]|nr:hypothetical protein [Bacteroidales bacterium]
MAYKLMVTARGSGELQWVMKPDGSPVSTSSGDSKSWVVESKYKDSISSDDFLKQTGLVWKKGIGKPMDIRNANGWTVKQL